jgi:iron complex outermembrane recepter protein
MTGARVAHRCRVELIALLGVVAVAGMVIAPPAMAQATSEPATRSFDIPAQPLTGALVQFGQQSGLQVAADGLLAASVRSVTVRGSFTPGEALTRLLAGTGLTFRFTGATTIQVHRLDDSRSGILQLDPVQVQGYAVPPQALIDNIPPPYAGGQVATGGQLGLLGNRGVMDTPFNQTNYTARKAQDQQAKTARDVLIDDPSVRSYFSDGGLGSDNMRIRGFEAPTSDFAFGGLYGMLPTYSVMAEVAERVEVLKGPAAMLNGMSPGGNIGGTVNLVPKRAPDEPLTQLTANYASGAQFGGHVDVARRFGRDKVFGARFNGVFKAGQTDVQWNSDQRALAVLGLDFRGERVRLAADLGYQYQYDGGAIPYLGIANGIPLPWAPSVRANPGAQPWNYIGRKDLFGVLRGEVDLTEKVTAYAAVGAHDNRFERLVGGISVTAANFNGNATVTPSLQNQYTTYLTAQAGLRALADTGPIGHDIAFNATMLQQEAGSATVSGTAFVTNFYAANVVARPNLPNPAANKTSSGGQSSLALADTLSAAEKRIQLTVGARLQQVTAANFNVTTGAQTSNYAQSAISPSVALVFKPWENVSIYGNWIQGLQQGVIVGTAFANAGEIFPPFKSTQFEAGVKVDWGKFTTTASAFQITQPSTITDVATNTLVLAGERRNQGIELNVFGEPMHGVRLLGGVMFLSGVLTKTQGGLTDGWIAPFAPAVQLNLSGEWDLPFASGLTVSGRLLYTGSQYIDTTFPRRSLPDWTRFDIGLRYALDDVAGPTGKPVTLRFNVENVLDANYWAGGGGATTLSLGAPRTFRLALTTEF